MENREQLLEQIGDVLSAEFSENHKKLENLLRGDKISKNLQTSLQQGLDEAALLQKDNVKGSIRYISFSLLLSSIISEKYSFAINLYDERFYLDELDAFSEWYFMEMAQFVNDDLAAVEKYLCGKQIPFLQADLIEAKKAQGILYITTYIEWLKTNIESVVAGLDISNVMCHEEIGITFGLYLESHEEIYSWKVCK